MKRIIRMFTILLCIFTVGYVVIKYIRSNPQDNDLLLSETPINILDIKPIGKLYLYTTEVEDYKMYFHEENNWIIGNKEIPCVQILKKRLNWVIDLDSIDYEVDSIFVHIRMPEVKFEMANIGSEFYPRGIRHNTNDLKRFINYKIEKKYNNKTYRDKARQRAKEFIALFVKKCGKEPDFVINKNSD